MKNLLFVLILIHSVLYSQNKEITGIYKEGLIGNLNSYRNYIELKSDSTFIYNNLGREYYGKWELSQNKILLNPKIKKEFAKVRMKESFKTDSDSITITINHIPKYSSGSKSTTFQMATVYFDKKNDYIHISKTPLSSCAWGPPVRKQKILNSNHSVTISKKDFSQIGFMTHNLNDYIVFTKSNPNSNVFEFEIEDIPYDEDIIKDEFFILDGKSLYYPSKKGKKDVMRTPLVKMKKNN